VPSRTCPRINRFQSRGSTVQRNNNGEYDQDGQQTPMLRLRPQASAIGPEAQARKLAAAIAKIYLKRAHKTSASIGTRSTIDG
jgi:hypothetical protein